jgi:putative nucleotidyltransferase with HDIG domain
VIAAAIVKRFQSKMDPAFNIEGFWCHSVTCAIAARLIALKLSIPNTERYFVAGLLHDIGKMVMYLLLPNESIKLLKALDNRNCDINNIEHELFGFSHDDVGVALLTAWHFPESLIAPIRSHASLNSIEHYSKDTAIIHLANNIANNLQTPVSRDDDTMLNPKALEILQITPDMIEAIYEETYRHMDALLEIFYYDVAA